MKRLALIYMLLVACFALSAQLLYEVSGNGLDKPSYLLGTHHAVAVSKIVDMPGVFRAFNDCDAVICEVVEENMDEVQHQILMASRMDVSLFDLLDDDEEALVDSALKAELGISIANVEYMRPNVIAMIYELTMREQLVGQKADDMSIDTYFQVAATELGKSVYGLETLEQQLDMLLRSTTLEQQTKNLVATIRMKEETKKITLEIEDAYAKGDIDALHRILVEDENMTEAEKFLLVDERNIDWLHTIVDHIKKKACFIAVGALHLPGNDGLINLLRKAGYKVKAVK
jgi:uncharacterized protein YbaP (TraB family)